jgi:hypothetical protein
VGREALPGGPPAALTAQRADVVVFACGDPAHAEHDSIAIAACTGLSPEILERIDLKLVGPMRPEYLRDLAPGTQVLIADTVPGTTAEIVQIPFLDLVGREAPLTAHSTPDQPLDEVIALAELQRNEPLQGLLIALEIESVDLTAPAPVDAVEAVRTAVERAARDITAT